MKGCIPSSIVTERQHDIDSRIDHVGKRSDHNDDVGGDHQDVSQLESHLWEAANILRGPVDAADFKTYVFPLLFSKRISDVHDEEHQLALHESDGDEEYACFPQNYRFQVPRQCHWSDVRAVTTNVGQALQPAMRGIEKANLETCYSIFGDAQWTNAFDLRGILIETLRFNMRNESAHGLSRKVLSIILPLFISGGLFCGSAGVATRSPSHFPKNPSYEDFNYPRPH
jgi:hypothetical protein